MADHVIGGLHCADASDLAAPFVLGALEPAEAEAVRTHIADCPEAHPEFADLGSVVPALFETVDIVEPPAALRQRILAAAADTQRTADTQRAADTQRVMELPRPAQLARPGGGPMAFRRPVWSAIAIAAALALVALGAWNLQLREQVDQLVAYRNAVASVLDAAATPGAQLAVLGQAGTTGGPTGLAAVSGNGATVSIVMRDLAPTTGTEVYEAWLIAGDAGPVPIGSFRVDASGVGVFTATAQAPPAVALTLALTREPRPGATAPTLPIIAAGTAAVQGS